MANANVNKVEVGNETLIDLTFDTATANDVALGKLFHSAAGVQQTGALEVPEDSGLVYEAGQVTLSSTRKSNKTYYPTYLGASFSNTHKKAPDLFLAFMVSGSAFGGCIGITYMNGIATGSQPAGGATYINSDLSWFDSSYTLSYSLQTMITSADCYLVLLTAGGGSDISTAYAEGLWTWKAIWLP